MQHLLVTLELLRRLRHLLELFIVALELLGSIRRLPPLGPALRTELSLLLLVLLAVVHVDDNARDTAAPRDTEDENHARDEGPRVTPLKTPKSALSIVWRVCNALAKDSENARPRVEDDGEVLPRSSD